MPLGISDDGDEQYIAEDKARQAWVHLTAFKRDCLTTIRAFEASGHAPKGLEIHEVAEAERGDEIPHSRIYQNLTDLEEAGLIDIGSKDKRTNEYTLSEHGREVLRAGSRRFATVDGGAGE